MNHRNPLEAATHAELARSLITQLLNDQYECMICVDRIHSRRDRFFSCSSCYALFHMKCLQKWVSKATPSSSSVIWRCPHCSHAFNSAPRDECFCGKETKPKRGLALGCANSCLKKRFCIHPCTMQCHPGPCPTCPLFTPVKCHCEKKTVMVRCAQLVKSSHSDSYSISCKQKCGKLLDCTNHSCQSICHDGPCIPCSAVVSRKCCCGKQEKEVDCKQSNSILECGMKCEKVLDCFNHNCERDCHAGECDPCPLSISNTKCPCGKSLINEGRTSCLDAFKCCNEICGKRMNCGHLCKERCHLGKCLSKCLENISNACQCGKTNQQDVCYKARSFKCSRICSHKRDCKRHECGLKCCSLSYHVCTLPCNKLLSCKRHKCTFKCHSSQCPPCMEASFNVINCHCGRTEIMPPIPCNFEFPSCPHPCQRNSCPHSSIHKCHWQEECPRCAVLIKKPCFCSKELISMPCWRKDTISCNRECSKPLSCGHFCQRSCHPGNCSDMPCNQICAKPKNCGHFCSSSCHIECSQECTDLVSILCPCGRLEKKVPCQIQASLSCDEECKRIERNRLLAEALGVSRKSIKKQELLFSTELLEFASRNKRFCCQVEAALFSFLKSPRYRLYFRPMNGRNRMFIIELCKKIGLDYEEIDKEENRSVVAIKSPSATFSSLIMEDQISLYLKWKAMEKESKIANQSKPAEATASLQVLNGNLRELKKFFEELLGLPVEKINNNQFTVSIPDSHDKIAVLKASVKSEGLAGTFNWPSNPIEDFISTLWTDATALLYSRYASEVFENIISCIK